MISLINRAQTYDDKIAIKSAGRSHTYQDLLERSREISTQLLGHSNDFNEVRIAFLVPSGFEYIVVQWAILRAGAIAVPLSEKHPLRSIEYVLEDTGASLIIYHREFSELLFPIIVDPSVNTICYDDFEHNEGKELPRIGPSRRAMILYTSGSTGKPKGVVTTHANIETQVKTLVQAWEWTANDHIFNVLPMHHVHGIINVTSCALWSGATCSFLSKFDAKEILKAFAEGGFTLFMGVPTIYYKLLDEIRKLSEPEQKALKNVMKQMRLMVSGSAALPVSVMEAWQAVSGHRLLERYGMTEIGMALSNPYNGHRRAGYVGQALPGVEVRLVDEQNHIIDEENTTGEIQVKGANVFLEYWGKPEATRDAFTVDGWFKTGDMALINEGSYRIIGRVSVDIIKSGGYKISALEIEEILRNYAAIKDCAVVGHPDEEWGEIVVAGVVTEDTTLDQEALSVWLKDYLPSYKTPRKYLILNDLPRNEMGKVTKKKLQYLFKEDV